MADLTTTTAVDTLMQAANAAGIRSAVFASGTAAGTFADADKILIGQSGAYVETTWGAVKAAILLAKYPEVANYAALPAVGTVSGQTYVALAAQGTYFINRKPAGFYYSNGTVWSYVGELPENYFTDSILQIADDVDPTKIATFQLSSITTGTTRVITVPNKSGTMAMTSDAAMTDARTPTSHASSHVTGGGDTIASAVAGGNAGLMTGADKTKLDGIAAGATAAAVLSIQGGFDGQGSAITAKSNFKSVESTGTITTGVLVADVSGSVTVTVKKYTPSAGALGSPTTLGTLTLSSTVQSRATGLSWAVTAGDVLEFVTSGISTLTVLSFAVKA